MEYNISNTILLESDFIEYYLNELANAETINNISYLNEDPLNQKYINLYINNEEAIKYAYSNDLSISSIEQIGNIINQTSPYIKNGLRSTNPNNKDTDMPNGIDVKENLLMLLEMYDFSKEESPFIKEALLHIGLIKYQILEDGNHRTAKFILDTNLLKQGIAPSIIKPSDYETYLYYLNNCKVKELASLLEQSSIEENYTLEFLYIKYKQNKRSRI